MSTPAELGDQEKQSPPAPTFIDEDVSPDIIRLSPQEQEFRRLSRRPNVDHLEAGTAIDPANGETIPLFDIGERIVVERCCSFLSGNPWLDTKVYKVNRINDDMGTVWCWDEELDHFACVAFKSPHQKIFLAPAKGDPFKAPRAPRIVPEPEGGEQPATAGKKKRGRPKGSKNRPKDVVKAERKARLEARKAKVARKRERK